MAGILVGLVLRNAIAAVFASSASLPLFLILGWLSSPGTGTAAQLYYGLLWYLTFSLASGTALLAMIGLKLLRHNRTRKNVDNAYRTPLGGPEG